MFSTMKSKYTTLATYPDVAAQSKTSAAIGDPLQQPDQNPKVPDATSSIFSSIYNNLFKPTRDLEKKIQETNDRLERMFDGLKSTKAIDSPQVSLTTPGCGCRRKDSGSHY